MADINFKIDEKYRLEIEAALTEYERQLGLPTLQKVEAPKYITMSLEDLRKLLPNELAEATLLINQYSLYIQRAINKNRAWHRWATSKLNEVASAALLDINENFSSYERTQLAKYNAPMSKVINQFLRKIEMQIELLVDIPGQLKIIGDCIRDIRFMSIKKEKAYD